ncbi:MAG: Ldh family oxidoreductase, partial [Candidatus Bathyarchaeia archaeon]
MIQPRIGGFRIPTFSSEYLENVCFHIFRAHGASEEEAGIVARHLVGANLAGHDSHGVIQTIAYVNRINLGQIVPGAPFEVEHETPTTARINGNWGFGFVVTERAMRLAIEKAKIHNVAAITVYYQSHIGRLADYTKMAAEEGMIGLITADSGAGKKSVVPFGGKEVRLGTNPLSIAVPSNQEAPVFLDMATSVVAAGKIGVARARKKEIPEGWILDAEGNPSTDPFDLPRGGGILPLGGDQGHKGFGLSFMVEMFSGILTGIGYGTDPAVFEARHGIEHRHNDGCFIAVFNVEAFRPLEEFKEEVSGFAEFVKTSPPSGEDGVQYPGEPEYRMAERLREEGIYIEEETWSRIEAIIADKGLAGKIG